MKTNVDKKTSNRLFKINVTGLRELEAAEAGATYGGHITVSSNLNDFAGSSWLTPTKIALGLGLVVGALVYWRLGTSMVVSYAHSQLKEAYHELLKARTKLKAASVDAKFNDPEFLRERLDYFFEMRKNFQDKFPGKVEALMHKDEKIESMPLTWGGEEAKELYQDLENPKSVNNGKLLPNGNDPELYKRIFKISKYDTKKRTGLSLASVALSSTFFYVLGKIFFKKLQKDHANND